jgi:dTDP-glucose 4,6-dehydratase
MIGNGSNHYQFVSVYDCARAAICAYLKGIPNSAYNLGSQNPPPVRELLAALIKEAGSKSVLVSTPAGLGKLALTALDLIGMPLMDPEQYLIADEDCIVDISRALRELDWTPRHRDEEMLIQAYNEYRRVTRELRPGPY